MGLRIWGLNSRRKIISTKGDIFNWETMLQVIHCQLKSVALGSMPLARLTCRHPGWCSLSPGCIWSEWNQAGFPGLVYRPPPPPRFGLHWPRLPPDGSIRSNPDDTTRSLATRTNLKDTVSLYSLYKEGVQGPLCGERLIKFMSFSVK